MISTKHLIFQSF